MDIFWKGITVSLTAVVILITLDHQSKNVSLLLALIVTCMICALALTFVKPVFTFIQKLQDVAKLDSAMIRTLVKAVGISIVTELSSLICEETGNKTLCKSVQFLGTSAILWLSIPLMEQVLSIIEGMLKQL